MEKDFRQISEVLELFTWCIKETAGSRSPGILKFFCYFRCLRKLFVRLVRKGVPRKVSLVIGSFPFWGGMGIIPHSEKVRQCVF